MSIYSILKADSAVVNITQKIHIGGVPQGTAAPYVVIDTIFINPENYHGERSGIDNARIGVDCYGIDQIQSVGLYEACRSALELHAHILAVNFYGTRDPELDVYRTQFDVSLWANR